MQSMQRTQAKLQASNRVIYNSLLAFGNQKELCLRQSSTQRRRQKEPTSAEEGVRKIKRKRRKRKKIVEDRTRSQKILRDRVKFQKILENSKGGVPIGTSASSSLPSPLLPLSSPKKEVAQLPLFMLYRVYRPSSRKNFIIASLSLTFFFTFGSCLGTSRSETKASLSWPLSTSIGSLPLKFWQKESAPSMA